MPKKGCHILKPLLWLCLSLGFVMINLWIIQYIEKLPEHDARSFITLYAGALFIWSLIIIGWKDARDGSLGS